LGSHIIAMAIRSTIMLVARRSWGHFAFVLVALIC
jgi:hypothetical protein